MAMATVFSDVRFQFHVPASLARVQFPALLGNIGRICISRFPTDLIVDHYQPAVHSVRTQLVVQTVDDVLLR